MNARFARRPCRFRIVVLMMAGLACGRAAAHSSAHAFSASSRAYVKINSWSRFYLQGENNWHLADGKRSWSTSGDLDFLLKPILKPIIKTPDIARDDYVLIRVGDKYVRKWAGGSGFTDEGYVSLLGRLPLPKNWEVADRNRIDLRSKNGFSWRYRTRPVVDWSWKHGWLTVQPFSQAEFFYDSRYGQIGRMAWQSGIDIGDSRSMIVEPSYTRRYDQQPRGQIYNSYHLRVYWYF